MKSAAAASQTAVEALRLEAATAKAALAAQKPSDDKNVTEAQLRLMRRLEREHRESHAAVVQHTMAALGHIIERTTPAAGKHQVGAGGALPSPWSQYGVSPPTAHMVSFDRNNAPALPAPARSSRRQRRATRSPGATRSRSPQPGSEPTVVSNMILRQEQERRQRLLPASSSDQAYLWHRELDALRMSHTDILQRVCATLDLAEPKELIPFSIRVSHLLASGNKLQAFVQEVRNLAALSSDADGGKVGSNSDDEGALRALRAMPTQLKELRELREFAKRVSHSVRKRPRFSVKAELAAGIAGGASGGRSGIRSIAAEAEAGAAKGGGSGFTNTAALEAVLQGVEELVDFEMSAVALRATLHKVDALLTTPEGAVQSTMQQMMVAFGVDSVTELIPTAQSMACFCACVCLSLL